MFSLPVALKRLAGPPHSLYVKRSRAGRTGKLTCLDCRGPAGVPCLFGFPLSVLVFVYRCSLQSKGYAGHDSGFDIAAIAFRRPQRRLFKVLDFYFAQTDRATRPAFTHGRTS
jgi:hypothetical protein